MNEIWKKIIGCDMYSISNFGRVRNDVTGRMRKLSFRIYVGIGLESPEGRKNFLIHRLVAIHFIPNPDNLPEVNHIDGNKENNHVSNLEWISTSDNQKHAIRTGLKLIHHEFHPGAIITMKIAREIRKLKSDGLNRKQISNLLGVKHSIVSRVIYNRAWKE